MCHGTVSALNLMGENDEPNLFLVGDLFMRKFYSVFDRENDRIGLAMARLPDV